MAEAQKSYGKTLAFSKLQMIPVREEEQKAVEAGRTPVETGQQAQADAGARKRRKE